MPPLSCTRHTFEALINLDLALLVGEHLKPCICMQSCKARICNHPPFISPFPFLGLCHPLKNFFTVHQKGARRLLRHTNVSVRLFLPVMTHHRSPLPLIWYPIGWTTDLTKSADDVNPLA